MAPFPITQSGRRVVSGDGQIFRTNVVPKHSAVDRDDVPYRRGEILRAGRVVELLHDRPPPVLVAMSNALPGRETGRETWGKPLRPGVDTFARDLERLTVCHGRG